MRGTGRGLEVSRGDFTWYVVMDLKITPSGQTIVKPTALGPVANTDTKLLICGLFQKGRILAQDGEQRFLSPARYCVGGPAATECRTSTEANTSSQELPHMAVCPSIRDLLFSVSQPLNRQVFLHRSTARAHGIAIQEPSPEAHPEPPYNCHISDIRNEASSSSYMQREKSHSFHEFCPCLL